VSKFASTLTAWQRRQGRSGLPWQLTRDPYHVWLSEVMLQQTQVAAVIPYYKRFLQRLPTVRRLAAASEEEVLALWSGLGYYARARNLHRAARMIVDLHGGRFPRSAAELEALPGLGRSSAAAIAAFAFGERAAILDGNVKRVLARCFGVEGWPGERSTERALWTLAESLLPARGIERYTQALMDLGATCCVKAKPACSACPVRSQCVARREGSVARLPAPRPRKPLPSRTVTWLVLLRAGQVLLERRPSAGLWGGLWTFPEVSAGANGRAAARRLGCEVSAMRRLDWLQHGFTHFRLRARPLVCQVQAAGPCAESPGRVWLDVEDAAGAAVPAPVRELLSALRA
jgi:A/G-specific adenine glycosylase